MMCACARASSDRAHAFLLRQVAELRTSTCVLPSLLFRFITVCGSFSTRVRFLPVRCTKSPTLKTKYQNIPDTPG